MKYNKLSEALELLEKYDIKTPKYLFVENKRNIKKIKLPFYLKIDSQKHKNKIGGISKCCNYSECKTEIQRMIKKFPQDYLLIQEEITGEEMFIGIKDDKIFGKIIIIGAGGSNVESEKDVEFRALPVDKKEIKKMIKKLNIYSQIKDNRTSVRKFIQICYNTIQLAQEKNIKELDLNPVILTKNRAEVVDARIFN